MATLLDVVDERGLAKPSVPVEIGRRIGFLERAALGASTDVAGRLRDLADASFSDDRNGLEELMPHFAPLLGADLENASGFLDRLADLLPLVDGQGERLFTINVLTSSHRMDGHPSVPMVGGADGDEIDVLALKQFSIVLVSLGFAFGAKAFDNALVALFIKIANGHNVGKTPGGVGITGAATAHTDGPETNAFVGGTLFRGKQKWTGNGSGGARCDELA